MFETKLAGMLYPGTVGCTPCQCGDFGGCVYEWVSYVVPLYILDLMPSAINPLLGYSLILGFVIGVTLLAKWSLGKVFKTASKEFVNIIASLIGSPIVWSFVINIFNKSSKFSINRPNNWNVLGITILSAAFIYLVLVFYDLKRKKVKLLSSSIGLIILSIIIFLIVVVQNPNLLERNTPVNRYYTPNYFDTL